MPRALRSSGLRPLSAGTDFFLQRCLSSLSGLSFLETASNPFITQMGSPASAARRLNFSQAFNTLGSIAGVLAGTVFMFSGVELSAGASCRAQGRRHLCGISAARDHAGGSAIPGARRRRAYAGHRLYAHAISGDTRARSTSLAEEGQGAGATLPAAAFSVGGGCAVPLRGRAGRNVELLHPVCAGLRPVSRRSIAGLLLTGTLGAFAVGRFSAAAADEAHSRGAADAAVCGGRTRCCWPLLWHGRDGRACGRYF